MDSQSITNIPTFASQRISEGVRAATRDAVFSSDFSVNEFLLVRKAGFEPVELCMGSSVYQMGIQYGNWSKNQELTVMSQAMYHARELAMARMREEAREMNADGIVGVKLTIKRLEFGSGLLEFLAFGTGVVHHKGETAFRAHDGGPFTSDLSGQDFYTLLHARYRPIEMVMGSCVYHVAHRSVFASMGSLNQNVELPNFTQAMYEAREIALERMQSEAKTAKAHGIVGVDLHEGSHAWQPHVIEFFAIGTAVSPIGDEISPEKIPEPAFVLPVND